MSYNFLTNEALGEDLFSNHSQDKIAEVIKDNVIDDENFKIVGIDGAWGSGKSNLVYLLEKKLNPGNKYSSDKKYKFFIYDVWGHQEDDQRRAILTEITDYIADYKNGVVKDKEVWSDRLKKLMGKEKEVTTTNFPHLSIGFILSFVLIIYVPTVNSYAKDIIGHPCLKALLVLAPILGYLVFFIWYYCKARRFYNSGQDSGNIKEWGWQKKIKLFLEKAFQEIFQIYNNKQLNETKVETITESEPNVKEFKEWMHDIDNSIVLNSKLIIVFDNFDRLPKKHILSIWSSIHMFFSEEKYQNIKVIIPFDRLHLKNAFCDLDADKKNAQDDTNQSTRYTSYSDDYINKTFDIVFRVSLPIMSDWKVFFETKWKKAIINTTDEELKDIIQIYEFLNRKLTPREIIAFINEVLTVKMLDNELSFKYIAIYVLCKDYILNDPLNAIIDFSYLKGLENLYKQDKDFSQQITAIVYHIPIKNSLDLIYIQQLTKALNDNDKDTLEKICQTDVINIIFSTVLFGLTEFVNPILCISSVEKEKSYAKLNSYNLGQFWKRSYDYALIKKQLITDNDQSITLDNYIVELFAHFKDDVILLKKVLGEIYILRNDRPVEVFTHIVDRLYEIIDEKVLFDNLNILDIEASDFLSLIESKSEKYIKYKCDCDASVLDDFLVAKGSDIKIKYLKIIAENKELPQLRKLYVEQCSSLANNASQKDQFMDRIERLKCISNPKEAALKDLLSDSAIYPLYNHNTGTKSSIEYESIAMRIAKGNSFNSSYVSYFSNYLNDSDPVLVEQVSKSILFYTTFNDLIFLLTTMTQLNLIVEVIKQLLSVDINLKLISSIDILNNYDTINQKLALGDYTLLEILNKSNIDISNIKFDILSKDLIDDSFSTKELDLSKRVLDVFNDSFNSLNDDDMKKVFDSDSNLYIKCFGKLDDDSLKQSAFSSFSSSFENRLMNNKVFQSDWLVMAKFDNAEGIISSPFFGHLTDVCINSKLNISSSNVALQILPYLFKHETIFGKKGVFATILKSDFLSDKNFLQFVNSNIVQFKRLLDENSFDDRNAYVNIFKEKAIDNQDLKSLGIKLGILTPENK